MLDRRRCMINISYVNGLNCHWNYNNGEIVAKLLPIKSKHFSPLLWVILTI